MSGSYVIPMFSQRWFGASASFLIHAAFFLVGGAVFTQSVEYAVELGTGGMEVYLVAAQPLKENGTLVADKNTISEPQLLPQQVVPEARGDGSSAMPGKDATTLRTAGGAETLAQPDYLKNPAPRYPEEARRMGEEGVVLIFAHVNSSGSTDKVLLKSGSGYPLLDEAALKAVRLWKFKPAKMGSMAIDSQVEIPVRFKLDKSAP